MPRVDSKTKLCKAHDITGCAMCMVDDFHDWVYEQRERRRARQAATKAAPIGEKFDLGGES